LISISTPQPQPTLALQASRAGNNVKSTPTFPASALKATGIRNLAQGIHSFTLFALFHKAGLQTLPSTRNSATRNPSITTLHNQPFHIRSPARLALSNTATITLHQKNYPDLSHPNNKPFSVQE
jgi:hypothetical protein